MTDQPMKCETCDKPVTLAEPRYVHADGKTYRHPLRPVPAGVETDPHPTTGMRDPRDNAALNAVAEIMLARFGFLPLSVRYDAARRALETARAGYAMHGDPDEVRPIEDGRRAWAP